MSYSILGGGQATKKQAMAGLQQSAQSEQKINIANEQMSMQEDAADKSVMATGASMGAMAATGTVGTAAAASAGMTAGTMGAAMVGGAATMGIGLVAAWALTELL